MTVATHPESEVDERFEALMLDFLAYMEFERGLAHAARASALAAGR